MKRFLLIAGMNYYPKSGTGDWIDSFDTKEAIEEIIIEKNNCCCSKTATSYQSKFYNLQLKNYNQDNRETPSLLYLTCLV